LHDDHFLQVVKDVELLPAVAARGWAFLTQDARIRYRSAEADALRAAGLRAFVVVSANLTAEMTVDILGKARAHMERACLAEKPPFIYRIGKDSSLRRVN
jgi:hypothetical protein